MRVIGGSAKGRRLRAPKGRKVRPTADRVKAALFNILPHDLSGLTALDLFAGSGNVGIEALSRGAAAATLVEVAPEVAAVVRENLERLGFADRCCVLNMPVARALRSLARDAKRFDLIFMDPPYGQGWVERILAMLQEGALLSDGAAVVAEHGARDPLAERYGVLALHDRRRYGDTFLSFYRRAGAAENR
jgi:16S rRNA (guanine(966)-N(2))-methyltransferase RsmD